MENKEQPKNGIDMNIEQEAINLVDKERTTYQDQIVFITPKVAFKVRDLIETLRKNYWGIFDKDKDPVTCKKLTWVPLTEWVVDTHVKNADIDSEQFSFKAKKPDSISLTSLVRSVVKNWMDDEVFGEDIDETERQLAIDGSHIWKTFKTKEYGKVKMNRTSVDLLNCYFDMTTDSIQKAYRFTERALLNISEIKAMDGWINTEDLSPTTGLHPTSQDLKSVNQNTTKFVDVWEMWGKIPYYFITGKKEDTQEVDGHIVVSGLEGVNNKRVHLIETNPSCKKPYEEFHTKKISGRWLARGPAESVMMLQSWLNMIVNIRKTRAQVSQLGIFKVKKGSGVSPQQFTRMTANGVMVVNNMDDIEQFVVQEAGATSYKDEAVAIDWAQRVTSTYEAVTGEELPASATATQLTIQKNSAGGTFVMFKKAMGYGITRWMKNLALPILTKTLTTGEVLRQTGDVNELRVLDERLVNYYTYKEIDKLSKEGKIIDPLVVEQERQNALTKVMKMGKDRYVKLLENIDLMKYDVQFFLNNETIDTNKIANNLISTLKLAPQYQDIIVKYLFDILGFDLPQLEESKAQQQMTQQPVKEPQLNQQQYEGAIR